MRRQLLEDFQMCVSGNPSEQRNCECGRVRVVTAQDFQLLGKTLTVGALIALLCSELKDFVHIGYLSKQQQIQEEILNH